MEDLGTVSEKIKGTVSKFKGTTYPRCGFGLTGSMM